MFQLDLNSFHLPVFDDCVGDRALSQDVVWQVEMLVAGQVGRGPVQEQSSEALEVVVRGARGYGKAGQVGHQPQHVLCVGAELAQQLQRVVRQFVCGWGIVKFLKCSRLKVT